MQKLVISLLIAVIAACAAHAFHNVSGDDIDWYAMLDDAKSRADDLEANDRQRREFMGALDRILERVEQGASTVAEAVQAIQNDAAVIYPDFLVYVNLVEIGDTLDQKLAYNIVRHFHVRHRRFNTSVTQNVLQRCESELRTMLGHELVDLNWVH